jgi:hypothetical protein
MLPIARAALGEGCAFLVAPKHRDGGCGKSIETPFQEPLAFPNDLFPIKANSSQGVKP